MNYYYIGLLHPSCFGLIEPARDTNYRRVEVTPMDWYSEEDREDTIFNAVAIEFPAALSSWGRITHFGFFDSLRNGNLIVAGVLQRSSSPIEKGDTVKFDIGKIKIENFIEELGINIDG